MMDGGDPAATSSANRDSKDSDMTATADLVQANVVASGDTDDNGL